MYIDVGFVSENIDLVHTAVRYTRPKSHLVYTAVG